ncbi:MAG TPA: TrbG/VirB9 family P-type conjugative transfer protein [Steroidobacteraceae bacterium]|nr:TrbG/VirB9 family P-type conjugative transfer protein [Steroidobacteraceae bacterium]
MSAKEAWTHTRSLTLLALLLCQALPGRAEVYPVRGHGDARIRTAPYREDEVYRIRGFVGFQIDLEFERGESFVGLAAGDIEGLSFVAEDNHLFLKPRVASVGTNLTVLTTRREYHFYYSATAVRPDQADPDLIYAVRFEYPPPPASRADAAHQAIEERLDRAPATRAQNLDYWYCGAPALRPVAASDDGIHTRLRFPAQAELPAIFVRNEDGSESLLNFDIEGAEVVIHRIARRFIVRRGALTGCIVNKGFTGSGDRLESGTVSPAVERVRKGTAP